MEIVREILNIIAEDKEKDYSRPIIIEGVSKEKIDYHIEIMVDADILKGNLSYGDNGLHFVSLSLSWRGNDFYDAFKNKTRWNGFKKWLKGKGESVGDLPFDLLIEASKVYLKDRLGL